MGTGPVHIVDGVGDGSVMEQLLDNPVLLVVVAALVLGFAGHRLWRWRRESAVRSHAQEQGWRPVERCETFADLAVRAFPELRRQAEQDARAARSRGGPGRGLGTTIRVGSSPSGGSQARARNAYRVPTAHGEVAVGDLTVIGKVGSLSQGRSSIHHAAALARAPADLPDLELRSRSWIDRDTRGNLPARLTDRFNDDELDERAQATYVDSGAYEALVDAPSELDGVTVDGDSVVLLSRSQLTPERAAALADTAAEFTGRALHAGAQDGHEPGPRLLDPLPAT